MRLVVDASVALKWYLAGRLDEDHVEEAAAVGDAIERRGASLYAPPHWAIEVISVLARSEPHLVDAALAHFAELRPTLITNPHVVRRAADLSISLKAHLFDTLYHAVALETGATLVTADERYWVKASSLGNIAQLANWRI